MRAMLLAAGRGTRMGGLTEEQPKPLLQVAGRTLLDRNLSGLADAGFQTVVVNVSYLGDRIRQAVGSGERWGLNVVFSQEPEPPLETAGGIVNALPLLGHGPFVLMNSDLVCDFDLASLRGRRPTLVLVPNPAHHPLGDFGIGDDGRVAADAPRYTFSGISVLHSSMFAGLASGPRQLKSVLDPAIERRELAAVVHHGLWIDVGTPQRLAQAERELSQGAHDV